MGRDLETILHPLLLQSMNRFGWVENTEIRILEHGLLL